MLECVCLVLQNNNSLFNLNNCFEFINNINEPIQLYIYIYDSKLLDNVKKMCDMIHPHYKDINYKIIEEFTKLTTRDFLYILTDNDARKIISNTELLNSFKTIMTPLNVKVNLNCGNDSKNKYEILDFEKNPTAHIKNQRDDNINLVEYDGEKTLDVEIMVNNKITPVKWIGKKQRYYQTTETNNDPIVLIQQYFIHTNKERRSEIDYCLVQNINNPHISKIILLNEETYKSPLLNNDKIQQVNIQRRLKFSEILRYIKYELKNTNVIFSNSDMFFDESLKNIHMGDFISNKSLDTMCRFEFDTDKTLDECVLRDNPRFHSQDAWIIHSSHVNDMDIKDVKHFDFQLGVPACDQKVVAEFDNLGYNIYNNPNKIKGYHYHSSQLRDYDPKDMLPLPYGYILPIIDNRTKHNDFMKEAKLFWQYPVITEKTFFEQNWKDNNYLPIPWATIIDKFSNLIEQIIPIIKKHYKDESYYTCCQTIYLDKLIPLMKACNVTKIYTPHKCKGLDNIDGIGLIACPLYAVNVEDSERNCEFKTIDLVNRDTKYLYSFKGAWEPHYISDVRKNIFDMGHQEDTFIQNIGKWHFLNDVYTNIQTSDAQVHNTQDKKNRTSEYNHLLLDSKFSLCPSGAGPNSIRFWESLAVGCIPVLLADTLELPKHEDWDKAILRVSEENVTNLEFLRDITDDEIIERRLKCIEIYNHFRSNYRNDDKFVSNKNLVIVPYDIKPSVPSSAIKISDFIENRFDKNNSISKIIHQSNNKSIVHYCCGSYDIGNFGGVAHFDYLFKHVFPLRKFFKGPDQKVDLINYLKNNPDTIVVTDNHLACDIPNEYKVFLIHHGCALTTAERNPDWQEPWKSLCTIGQKKMLNYRDPNNTIIISCSKSCIEDFKKYFGKTYTRFKINKILHTSKFDTNIYKKEFNSDIPIVLGNWDYGKKGLKIIERLVNKTNKFKFKKLSIYPNNSNIDEFDLRKQNFYLESDIFLQTSNSEGGPYATIDAMVCGIPVVATNVGMFEYNDDIPDNCFVRINIDKLDDTEYIISKLEYAWHNKEMLTYNARNWFIQNCSFDLWCSQFKSIIENSFN